MISSKAKRKILDLIQLKQILDLNLGNDITVLNLILKLHITYLSYIHLTETQQRQHKMKDSNQLIDSNNPIRKRSVSR